MDLYKKEYTDQRVLFFLQGCEGCEGCGSLLVSGQGVAQNLEIHVRFVSFLRQNSSFIVFFLNRNRAKLDLKVNVTLHVLGKTTWSGDQLTTWSGHQLNLRLGQTSTPWSGDQLNSIWDLVRPTRLGQVINSTQSKTWSGDQLQLNLKTWSDQRDLVRWPTQLNLKTWSGDQLNSI